jgi:DNA-binding FadR family transcriptional regulator
VAGQVIDVELMAGSYQVSRGVIREVLRTLVSLGMVDTRQRVGTRVLARQHWALLSPRVIYWRGRGPDYLVQHRELLEARLGIEPTAAGLCVTRMTDQAVAQLAQLVAEMRLAWQDGDRVGNFQADAAFHRAVLAGSGNAVFTRFGDVISAALDVRGAIPRPGIEAVSPDSLTWHDDLAAAIASRDAQAAQAASRAIIAHTLEELADAG